MGFLSPHFSVSLQHFIPFPCRKSILIWLLWHSNSPSFRLLFCSALKCMTVGFSSQHSSLGHHFLYFSYHQDVDDSYSLNSVLNSSIVIDPWTKFSFPSQFIVPTTFLISTKGNVIILVTQAGKPTHLRHSAHFSQWNTHQCCICLFLLSSLFYSTASILIFILIISHLAYWTYFSAFL